MGQRRNYYHKRTVFCPVVGCNYTSRTMLGVPMNNKLSSHSDNCPTHRERLVSESEKKEIENKDVMWCNFSGCTYTQKHDDGKNCCPTHRHILRNVENYS